MPAATSHRFISRIIALSALVGLTGGAMLLTSTNARAEETPGISATGKGITGGVLLGSELVMSSEAAFGVRNTWMYVLGGVVGAGAGGYAGYYMESNADAKYSYYMLAGGMALAIPTTVAILQATSYDADQDYQPDQAPSDMTPSTSISADVHARLTPAKPSLPLSVVGLQQGDLQLGIPAVAVLPTYTPVEMRKFGVQQHTEVRVPVFSAVF